MTTAAFQIEDAWLGDDVVMAWVELQVQAVGSPTVTTYAWSGVALSHPSSYFGGFKNAQVLSFGQAERMVSDPDGQFQGTGDWTVRLSDFPDADGNCVLRGWMGETNPAVVPNMFMRNRYMVVRCLSKKDYDDGKTPIVVARGLILKTSTVADTPFSFEFSCQGPFGPAFNDTVPRQTIDTNFFPKSALPVDISDIIGAADHEQVDTVTPHNYANGDMIVMTGNYPASLNGAFGPIYNVSATSFYFTSTLNVTATDTGTVTRPKKGSGALGQPYPVYYGDSTGAATLLPNAVVRPAQWPCLYVDDVALPMKKIVAITRSGTTATVTVVAHGWLNGYQITLDSCYPDEYNGEYTISGVTTDTFNITVASTLVTPAPGVGYASRYSGGSATWARLLVVGHACKAIPHIYFQTGSEAPVLADDHDGVDLIFPGSPSWASLTGATHGYRDVSYNGEVRRFTFVYARGPWADLFRVGPTGTLTTHADGSPATGTLSLIGTNFQDKDQVVIGKTYTMRTSLSGLTGNGDVLIGANANLSLDNLAAAINLTGSPGTQYTSQTTQNTNVVASVMSTVMSVITNKDGVNVNADGSSITSTTTSGDFKWDNGDNLIDGAADIDTSSPGAQLLVDIQGVESTGDGTGSLLVDGFDIYKDLLANTLLQTYQAGPRLTSPLYVDGVTQVDTAAFTTAKDKAQLVVPAGIILTGGINSFIRASDVAAMMHRCLDVYAFVNRSGQISVRFASDMDPAVQVVSATDDILAGSFSIDEHPDELANVRPWQAGMRYNGVSSGYALSGEVSDVVSINNYSQPGISDQRIVAPQVANLDWIHDQVVVDILMARKLARSTTVPVYAPMSRGLHALGLDLCDVMQITHPEGYGPRGWDREYVQIYSMTPQIDDGLIVVRALRLNSDIVGAIVMGDIQLGGIYRIGGFSGVANGNYRVQEPRVGIANWDSLPSGWHIKLYVDCNVETGASITPYLVRISDGVTVWTGSAQTTALTDNQVASGVGRQSYLMDLIGDTGTEEYELWVTISGCAAGAMPNAWCWGILHPEQ